MVLNKDLIDKVKKTKRGEPSILVPSEIESVERFQFSWENREILTKFIKKSIKSTVKFVVKEGAVSFIIGKNGSFTKYMQDELHTFLKCYRDKSIRAIEPDESIAVSLSPQPNPSHPYPYTYSYNFVFLHIVNEWLTR